MQTTPASTPELKAPHGAALLTLIGLSSAVVFIAGLFRCARADFKDTKTEERDSHANSGNTGAGCSGDETWAMFAGLVAVVLVAGLLLFQKIPWSSAATTKSTPVFGAFLSVWWLIAALVLTFKGPFFLVSNGFLGAWIASLASLIYALEVSKRVHNFAARVSGERDKINAHVLILIVASVVELIAAALFCKAGCTGLNAYAVAVGAASIFFCLVLVLDPTIDAAANHLNLSLAVILFLWWFVAAIILTFITPFVEASNGFWATWVAAFTSGFIAKEAIAARMDGLRLRGSGQPAAAATTVTASWGGRSDPAAA